MERNVGQLDKIVRLIIGILIVIAGFYYQSWWGLIGLIFIGTGLINYCGVYSLLGISTCENNDNNDY